MYLSKASSLRTALEHLLDINLSVCLPSPLLLSCVHFSSLVDSALALVDPLSTLCLIFLITSFLFPSILSWTTNPSRSPYPSYNKESTTSTITTRHTCGAEKNQTAGQRGVARVQYSSTANEHRKSRIDNQ